MNSGVCSEEPKNYFLGATITDALMLFASGVFTVFLIESSGPGAGAPTSDDGVADG